MTIEEIKSGKPFMYKDVEYRMGLIQGDSYYITKFNGIFVASVEHIGTETIDVFAYVMDKRVDVSINIDDCKEVE